MPAKVLDSFALIAYFRDEPGAETVENLLVAAGKKDSPLHMTDVNYAEVKYSIVKRDCASAWEEAAKILQGLPIDFHSTTRQMADTAADFKARFPRHRHGRRNRFRHDVIPFLDQSDLSLPCRAAACAPASRLISD